MGGGFGIANAEGEGVLARRGRFFPTSARPILSIPNARARLVIVGDLSPSGMAADAKIAMMYLNLAKPSAPMSNAERQREFRKRHPGYHRRYRKSMRTVVMNTQLASLRQAMMPAPTPAVAPAPVQADAQVAPTGC